MPTVFKVEVEVVYYTTGEAAERCGRTRQWVWNRCNEGMIDCIVSDKGPGKRKEYLVPEGELRKFQQPTWPRGKRKRRRDSVDRSKD